MNPPTDDGARDPVETVDWLLTGVALLVGLAAGVLLGGAVVGLVWWLS